MYNLSQKEEEKKEQSEVEFILVSLDLSLENP